MSVVPFKKSYIGFFCDNRKALAAYLGVCPRQILNWLTKVSEATKANEATSGAGLESVGEAPAEYREKIAKLSRLEIFPLDEVPVRESDPLDPSIYRMFHFLEHGDEEVAGALAWRFLNRGPDWRTGGAANPLPELELLLATLASCIAWTRNPHAPSPSLSMDPCLTIRDAVATHFAKQKMDPLSDDWPFWSMLAAYGHAYWMTAYGTQCEIYDASPERKQRRMADAKFVVQTMMEAKALELCALLAKGSNAKGFLAFNLAQFAAVAEDSFVFNKCLRHLFDRYREINFINVILPILRDDGDTKPMLESPKVVTYLEFLVGTEAAKAA